VNTVPLILVTLGILLALVLVWVLLYSLKLVKAIQDCFKDVSRALSNIKSKL
jgi:hypothetical protein